MSVAERLKIDLTKKEDLVPDDTPKVRLDIACGQRKYGKDWTGVDFVRTDDCDVQWDLDDPTKPWPFEDSSVDEIYSSHFIEHVVHLPWFMSEIYRICKHDAPITIHSPYYTSERATQDWDHKRAIGRATYLYFNMPWLLRNKLEHTLKILPYDVVYDFAIEGYSYVFNKRHIGKSTSAKQSLMFHDWNAVDDIVAKLRVRKGDGPFGLIARTVKIAVQHEHEEPNDNSDPYSGAEGSPSEDNEVKVAAQRDQDRSSGRLQDESADSGEAE